MAESLHADMSANVWRILVSVGADVAPDEPIMILESMKMEIPVVSDDGGKVAAIHVAEGDNVSGGQLLVDLE
jgi:acetyl-CoA carboxylase biotin carboxyl carrier protein